MAFRIFFADLIANAAGPAFNADTALLTSGPHLLMVKEGVTVAHYDTFGAAMVNTIHALEFEIFGVVASDTSHAIDSTGGSNTLHVGATGSILGAHAIRFGESTDILVNDGYVSGAVNFGGGNDDYDASGGRTIGRVDLGAGDDTAIGSIFRDEIDDGDGIDDVALGGGNDILVAGAGDDHLDGGEGIDLYVVSFGAQRVSVDLTLGFASGGDTGFDQIAGFERVRTNVGADVLRGSTAANILDGGLGNDQISGLNGNDRLIGGLGADRLNGGNGNDYIDGGTGFYFDTLTGGTGADRFCFENSSVGTFNVRDQVTDYEAGLDSLNLAKVDANFTTLGIDDAFTNIGAAAFTAAGQLRWYVSGGNTYVEMNQNANLAADGVIELLGIKALTAEDFIL